MLPKTETNSIAAYYLLFSLYDSLGLELDDETAALFIDNDLRVHFDYSGQIMEMICPLGTLPAEMACMQLVSQMSSISPFVLTADAKGKILLTLQMPKECTASEFVETLQRLIQTASVARQELGLISASVSNY